MKRILLSSLIFGLSLCSLVAQTNKFIVLGFNTNNVPTNSIPYATRFGTNAWTTNPPPAGSFLAPSNSTAPFPHWEVPVTSTLATNLTGFLTNVWSITTSNRFLTNSIDGGVGDTNFTILTINSGTNTMFSIYYWSETTTAGGSLTTTDMKIEYLVYFTTPFNHSISNLYGAFGPGYAVAPDQETGNTYINRGIFNFMAKTNTSIILSNRVVNSLDNPGEIECTNRTVIHLFKLQ